MSTIKNVCFGVVAAGFAYAIYNGISKCIDKINEEISKQGLKDNTDKPEKTIFERTLENCVHEGEWPLNDQQAELKKDFEEAFHAIEKEIPFRDMWHNGTGYLDGGVRDDLGLEVGEKGRSIDPLTGRKIIIIGVLNRDGKLTNCLHFERNVPGKGSYCVVNNYDRLDKVPSWK